MKHHTIRRRDFIACGLGAFGVAASATRLFAAQKLIRIAYSAKFVPMSFLNSDNRMTGVYVDLFDAILGQKMGFEVEHIGLPWKRAQRTVETGNADAFCTNATSARRAYMNFCDQSVIESRKAVIFRRGSILDIGQENWIELEELKHFRHINYQGNGWAKENLREFDLQWTGKSKSATKMVAHNRADVFITNEYLVRHHIKQLRLNEALNYRPIKLKKKSLHKFGIRKSYPDSRYHINVFCEHLNEMKSDGSFENISARFI